MRKHVRAIVFVLILAMASGCMTTTMNFDAKLMSSKPLPVETVAGPRVRGEDCVRYVLLFFPIGARSKPSYSKALERALEGSGADALDDVIGSQDGWTVLLYGRTCYVIEGTAVTVKNREK